MKAFAAAVSTALLTFAAWPVAAASGSAPSPTPSPRGEHRLTAAEIRELARRELLWCDAYKAESDDCEAVTLVRLLPDGRLAETTTLLIEDAPRLQAFLGDFDHLDGDRICQVVKPADTHMSFTLDGQAVPEGATAALKAVLLASLAQFEGKTMCQAFYREADPTRLREEVTVDGQRRHDLETTYVLREGSEGFALRPEIGHDDKNERKT